ncbi:MAG: DUF2171 domain-containing protein [Thermomicrobiales bacterium]
MERFAGSEIQQHHLQQGAQVFGVDGDKMGKVKTWDEHHLVVEKGLIFSTDYWVPFSAVEHYTEDEVFLKVTKDEALNSGWDSEPNVDEGTFLDASAADQKVSSRAFRKDAFEIDPVLPPRTRI